MLTEHFTQSAGLENAWSDAVEGLRLRIYPEAFLESHGIKVRAKKIEDLPTFCPPSECFQR